MLRELNVDAGERGERETGSRKEEDGQLTKGGRGRKSECALRGRDNGGGGDQDGARGQQNAEERGMRRGHFGLVFFLLLFKVLDNCGGSSRIETEDGDWGGTLLFATWCVCFLGGWGWNEMEREGKIGLVVFVQSRYVCHM